MPFTDPPVAVTVAFPVLLLTHVPPVVPMLLSVVKADWHTVNDPEIGVGIGNTVITVPVEQPVVPRKLITLVPADIPATTPDVTPIVATAVLLLVHDVPTVGKLITVVLPWQTVLLPDIDPPTPEFTVMFFVLKQPPTL